ncbi:hypothetical protein UCDDA912_g08562 [Diaporthe ampelina]|uniref:Uncharacterized protein n=1 Tax=Diaporthe ampelina TaxID=1214573 RepID=A0A0G2HTS6_9PEZI|nr:hypothetical protein UCDDA912_g08562 [Diaporthe ampelina]
MEDSHVPKEAAKPTEADPDPNHNFSRMHKLGQNAARFVRKMASSPLTNLIMATCKLLFLLVSQLLQEHFDDIGEMFSHQLKRPDKGPSARSDKLSLLDELTPQQIESLSAPQLAQLLQQRGHANEQAIIDRFGFLGLASCERPFLKNETQECKQTLCPPCGKGMMGQEVAFLDLDGVLRGDIPPTVALGYGFRKYGRPIADANIMRNIGLRKVPEKDGQAAQTVPSEGNKIEKCVASNAKDEDETALTTLTDAPLTPSNTFLNMADSSEDLLELYTDGSSVEASQDNAKAQGTAPGEN